MDTREFERIKRLIKDAEIESAKAQGVLDNIKKDWREKFGTDDITEIRKKLDELKEERDKLDSRLNNLYTKLENSYDWDALERQLNG